MSSMYTTKAHTQDLESGLFYEVVDETLIEIQYIKYPDNE